MVDVQFSVRARAVISSIKGSIAVDGISLTVATLHVDRFEVQIVPFTLEHTNLRSLRPDDRVNLECDLVGKSRGKERRKLRVLRARAGEPDHRFAIAFQRHWPRGGAKSV